LLVFFQKVAQKRFLNNLIVTNINIVVSLTLTAEYMEIDSENHLFRQIPNFFGDKIERSVYNRRKRRLSFKINETRQKLARNFLEFADCFVVGSMSLEGLQIPRSHRSTIYSEK